jgi:hypothetical protein
MTSTPFELTPEQKGLLATLSRETGKSIPALLAEALDALQEHARSGQKITPASPPAQEPSKPIWEQFAEAFDGVPDEEIARLPTDLAAQVDHYVYGLPKRPV